MKILLIDDRRIFPCDKVAKTYAEGLLALAETQWDVLYIDHDLGTDKTGYDILCWLEQNPQHVPKKIIVVSQNPSGRARMQLVVDKLLKDKI